MPKPEQNGKKFDLTSFVRMRPKAEEAKGGKQHVDLSSFVRMQDIEPFFVAINANPVVRMTSKDGLAKNNPEYYQPNAIDYFADRGFFPVCVDVAHGRLSCVVNRDYAFPKYMLVPDSHGDTDGNDPTTFSEGHEENAHIAFSASIELYCPEFFQSLPKALADVVASSPDNLDFKFVDKGMFDRLHPFVRDPSRIKAYELQRKVSDNRERGLITEDVDSVAGQMLDLILTHAVANKGTDVHIEYTGASHRARIRIDGDLRDYPVPLDPEYYAAIVQVIRIRSELDVAQHFQPQDGMFQFDASFVDEGKISSYYDIRVSIIPQADGRLNAVLRIQPKGQFKHLSELGFTPVVHEQVGRLCLEPHGMILVTGPTGSGKTTTLYSILNELNTTDVKIVTAEDPPEIRMDGPTQVAINDKQGRTFPTMLRSFLRHDPDIILVGEIRDSATAKLAIEAANTGHLVLSTLHTNDAVSAIKRLGNMEGVDPADFAFSLKGVLAQRLIKTFRQDIRDLLAKFTETGETNDIVNRLIADGVLSPQDLGHELNLLAGEQCFPEGNVGCFAGSPDAFRGRTAITEFWKLGVRAADLIFDKHFSTIELTRVAIEHDRMIPMAVTGLEKVVQGVASLENVLKGVGMESIKAHREAIIAAYFMGVQE